MPSSETFELGKLKTQMIISLLFLFLFFVVMDAATTTWLARNSPGGIVNEVNPVGISLYRAFGLGGMIFAKFGLFAIFALMATYFPIRYPERKWFVEVTQTLVLVQIAISVVVTFNNFIAILATYYVNGVWPLVQVTPQGAVLGIYAADLGLGAIFANGVMYMWGMRKPQTHLKVFVSLMVFITPVLLFAAGFRTEIWLFATYITSSSVAIAIFFYITEHDTFGKGAISPK
jgi:hypothetical protein